jgi:hypothetical protein
LIPDKNGCFGAVVTEPSWQIHTIGMMKRDNLGFTSEAKMEVML